MNNYQKRIDRNLDSIKIDNQTFVEFSREKEDLFDQWFKSKKLDKTFF